MPTDVDVMVRVNQDAPKAVDDGNFVDWKGSKRGEGCVIDFYTEMLLEGRVFQVRAGTISAPLVGDVLIVSTDCEMSVDAGQGFIDIIVFANISINLATGTLHEYAIKTIDTPSVSGATFVPLKVLGDTDGASSQSTARVEANGAVQVASEAVTDTATLWSVSNPKVVGAGHEITTHLYEPRMPHAIANGACVYMQVAASTTGPSYFAHMDWIELLWTHVS